MPGSLKGLKLRIFKNSGNKIFVLNYWYNKKSNYYTLGQFTDTFGTEEVEDKLIPIVRSHKEQNEWTKCPKETDRKNKAKQERLIESEDYV